jgi:hypothetical protein
MANLGLLHDAIVFLVVALIAAAVGYPRVLVRRSRSQPVLSKPVPPQVLASTLRSLARA